MENTWNWGGTLKHSQKETEAHPGSDGDCGKIDSIGLV